MILASILILIALLLIAFIVGVVSIGGATMIVIFGDVIVCIFSIGLIIKLLIRK